MTDPGREQSPGGSAPPNGAGDIPFPPRSGAGGIPRILTTLIERLDDYLTDPAAWLPGLNHVNGKKNRQQRRERRSACVKMLRVHIKYLDLASMRVGVPQANGGFLNLTLKFLARQAGIGQRRAERAMHDLQMAGLVSTQSRCEKDDAGQYRGLASLRQLPPALFGAFGLGKWLKHERSKAVFRRHRAAAVVAKSAWRDRHTSREAARGELSLAGARHRLDRRDGGCKKAKMARPHVANTDVDDQVRRRIGSIKLQHPDWDREACYAQAYREIAPRR